MGSLCMSGARHRRTPAKGATVAEVEVLEGTEVAMAAEAEAEVAVAAEVEEVMAERTAE